MTPSSLQGRRVLLTGASGFIGSRLLRRLEEEGAEIHALSRRPGERTAPRGGTSAISPIATPCDGSSR